MQKTKTTSLLLAVLLTLTITSTIPLTLATNGPRTDDLVFYYYSTKASAYAAMKLGQADLYGHPLTYEQYVDAIADSNVVIAPVESFDMFEFDINNDEFNPMAPSYRSPTSYLGFRQALAFLTDKDYIVNSICGGFAERIDQPIAAIQESWKNESYWYPNYPYEYNPSAAAQVLDNTGFAQGTTSNPDYRSSFPGSAQYMRTYPPGHSKAGQDLDPLEIVVMTDDYNQLFSGRHLYNNMKKHGIPVHVIEAFSISSIFYKVFVQHAYHVYTGDWKVGRFPPPHLYYLYHSEFSFPYGRNYVTGDGTYPHLDSLLYDGITATSFGDSVTAVKLALGYFTEQCITIPLWSTKGYEAWRKELLGVVSMEGVGILNGYTFMNTYKEDLSPIRVATYPPFSTNIIYASDYYDFLTLDRMTLCSELDIPPYDPPLDQPGFVRDWDVDTWNDNGAIKTKLTRTYRSDSWFAEPVTGDQKANVNSTHIFFSAWYMYQNIESWWSCNYDGVHHINIVNDREVDIYFDTLSYWNQYSATGPLLPIDTWSQHSELVEKHTESFTEGNDLATPGYVNLNKKPTWIVSVKANGAPLTMFTDYNIVKGQLYIYKNLNNGAHVEVEYWSPCTAYGSTPGDVHWQTSFEGAGMYYVTDYVPGEGGHITFARNPFYYMETPVLGEIDFKRESTHGGYEVTIFDIVAAASAYDSQGTGIPDLNWLPGADVALPGGIIDIFDIVTITGKYGQTSDIPP